MPISAIPIVDLHVNGSRHNNLSILSKIRTCIPYKAPWTQSNRLVTRTTDRSDESLPPSMKHLTPGRQAGRSSALFSDDLLTATRIRLPIGGSSG